MPAAAVAEFCLELARSHPDPDVAEPAVVAVALVDADSTPELIAIARDRDRQQAVRKSAIFWLGLAAGEKVVGDLTDVATDDRESIDLREHAVFALHQALADDQPRAVTTLGAIATSEAHPEIRQSALFWLSQIDDPAVIDLFSIILRE